MNTVYLGLDVGTSGCKAALVDGNGKIHKTARRTYGFESSRPGMVELNPVTVWEAVCDTLSEISSCKMEIRMLAVSSIGEAVVMTGSDGQVLRNGITLLDSRGPETAEYIKDRMDARYLHSITGVPVSPMYTLSRYIWLREHQPDIVEKTARYFMFGDYITYMLTGERVIDPSSASRTMLFDGGRMEWSKEIGETFDVPLEKFSEVSRTGTVVGRIRKRAAERTGLPEDIKVVLGCHDQCSALLGSGAVEPGDIMAGEGSTESINLVFHKSSLGDAFFDYGLCFEPYVWPEQYIAPVGQLSHGISIRWFVQEFWSELGADGRDIYEQANERCAKDAEDVYFLPYLSKVKSMDAADRAPGVFTGLDVNTGRSRMYRALLEGLCFESKVNFDILKRAGLPIHRIVASGGCSKSPLLMQMKADVLRRPIHILSNPDAGVTGLAMICAVADGLYRDYGEAARVFVSTAASYMPDKDYTRRYEKYREIRRAVRELYKAL